MANRSIASFFIWSAAGTVCFLTLPLLTWFYPVYYAQKEPYLAPPVPVSSQGLLIIRNDSNGKGHFGASRDGGRTHKGIDLAAPLGYPIFAAKSGRVSISTEEKGYGKYIEIIHPDGLRTRYAHLALLGVREGEWARQAQLIGKNGKSGNAADPKIKPHLHFEVRGGQDEALNPTGMIDPVIGIR